MNITRENIDDLNAIIRVEIKKEDFEDKVTSVLKDYKKKSNLKGFRPGNAPIGLIKKLYGDAVMAEEVNKLVSESLTEYIRSENLEILGEPLPSEQNTLDMSGADALEFAFEVGLTPSFEIKLNEKTKLPWYEITIDDKLRREFLENYTRRYGKYEEAETVEEEDLVKADISQLDEDGNIQENGLSAQNSTMSIAIIKDKDFKKKVAGSRVGDEIDFNIDTAYPNDHEKSGLLQVDKERAGEITGMFRVKITAINRFSHAELNQELFDQVYGEGVIAGEEEFMKKLEEEIRTNLNRESDFKLNLDARQLALDKTKINLPEEFLKRWLAKANSEISAEDIEKDFPRFLEDLRWQIIKNRIASENELKIEPEELMTEARNYTRAQFRQYGLYYAADEQIDQFAGEMLKREEDYRKIAEQVLEVKVMNTIRDMVKVETKKVTSEEFNKIVTG
ncbi:MAG: trigger factor [Bacteroidales bacterium]|nr:trigger factor [Bacteroidales bacterium]